MWVASHKDIVILTRFFEKLWFSNFSKSWWDEQGFILPFLTLKKMIYFFNLELLEPLCFNPWFQSQFKIELQNSRPVVLNLLKLPKHFEQCSVMFGRIWQAESLPITNTNFEPHLLHTYSWTLYYSSKTELRSWRTSKKPNSKPNMFSFDPSLLLII